MNCIFCKIISKDAPANIIYEDDNTIAFATKDPVSKGHTLVIPKAHVENLFDISRQELADLGVTTQKVATLLKDHHRATGMNLLHASGKDAQQSVSHFHLHIVPRFKDDGLDMWIKQGL